jgi:hypothetical protein
MLSLNFEQARFNCGGAPQPPQQTGQPQHQFALNSRLGIVVCRNGGLEGFVILRILQRTDHCLGRQAVAHGIAAGTLFAFSVTRPVLLRALALLASSV